MEPRSRSHTPTLPRHPSTVSGYGTICCDAEPVDLAGPFSVELLEVLRDARDVAYALRVTGSDGEHVIHRRYTSFATLSRSKLVETPEMPPKSLIRKRFSPEFMEERSARLQRIAVAAVSADPYADAWVVRRFLGLKSEDGSVRETRKARFGVGGLLSPWGRNMSIIAEADHEKSMDSTRGSNWWTSTLGGSKVAPMQTCFSETDDGSANSSVDRSSSALLSACTMLDADKAMLDADTSSASPAEEPSAVKHVSRREQANEANRRARANCFKRNGAR